MPGYIPATMLVFLKSKYCKDEAGGKNSIYLAGIYRVMNPKQSVASSGQKRSPPRRACKKCPACLAPPCKMCSNCLNIKFKKRCKQRVCPNLGQHTPSSSSPPSSAATGQVVESCPSTSTGISSTGDTTSIYSNLLSSIPSRDAVELQDSQADHRMEVVINKSSSSSQQLESQETRGRTRQRLQEEHIRLKVNKMTYFGLMG